MSSVPLTHTSPSFLIQIPQSFPSEHQHLEVKGTSDFQLPQRCLPLLLTSGHLHYSLTNPFKLLTATPQKVTQLAEVTALQRLTFLPSPTVSL